MAGVALRREERRDILLPAHWLGEAPLLAGKVEMGLLAGLSLLGVGMIAYFRHAQTYYLKHGRPTSEQDNIRQALRFVRRLYGGTPACRFGTKALQNVRQAMIEGYVRRCLNDRSKAA